MVELHEIVPLAAALRSHVERQLHLGERFSQKADASTVEAIEHRCIKEIARVDPSMTQQQQELAPALRFATGSCRRADQGLGTVARNPVSGAGG